MINDYNDGTKDSFSRFADDIKWERVAGYAIQSDFSRLEKWVDRTFMEFNKGNAKSYLVQEIAPCSRTGNGRPNGKLLHRKGSGDSNGQR